MVIAEPLVRRTLGDHFRNIVSWVSGVVLIVVVQLLVYPTIRDSSAGWSDVTQDFPEVLKKMLRLSDYTSETGYLNTELLSFTVPFMFVMLGATWGARVCTEDEESGRADVILSLPVSRSTYVASRLVAAFAVVGVAATAFTVTLMVGARLLHMSIANWRFVTSGVCLFLLGLVTTTVAVVAGSLTGRRGVALGVATTVAIASFVTYSLAPLVGFFEFIEPTSPFRWTIGTQPLTNHFSVGYALLTVGVSSVFTLMSLRVYGRRDIRV